MNRALHRHEENAGQGGSGEESNSPSPGRIVLHVNDEGVVHPAIVVRVLEGNAVSLRVFTDAEDAAKERAASVPFDENQKPSTWHWPPKG